MDAIVEAYDGDIQMIDSSNVRVHQHAAGSRRGSGSLHGSVEGDPGFEVSLDATQREPANDNGDAEHGTMLRGALRW